VNATKSVWLYNLNFSTETSLHDVRYVKLYNLNFSTETSLHDVHHVKLVIRAYLSTCISTYYSERVHPFTHHFRVSVWVCVCLGEHNAKYIHTRSTEPVANNKTTLNCVQQVTALPHHNYSLSDEEILSGASLCHCMF